MADFSLPAALPADVAHSFATHPEYFCESRIRQSAFPDESNIICGELCQARPTNILSWCHGFKVIGSHARALSTEMIYLQSLGYGANKLLVGSAMCKNSASAYAHSTVSSPFVRRRDADPARSSKPTIFFSPEIRGKYPSLLRLTDVPSNKPNRFPFDVAYASVGHRRNSRLSTAPTLAEAVQYVHASSLTKTLVSH